MVRARSATALNVHWGQSRSKIRHSPVPRGRLGVAIADVNGLLGSKASLPLVGSKAGKLESGVGSGYVRRKSFAGAKRAITHARATVSALQHTKNFFCFR